MRRVLALVLALTLRLELVLTDVLTVTVDGRDLPLDLDTSMFEDYHPPPSTHDPQDPTRCCG